MLVVHASLAGWAVEATAGLDVSPEAKAYAASTLDRIARDPAMDMSRESIVLSYASAAGLPQFQRIGDWVLFKVSILPSDGDDLLLDFGRLSYARCYRLVRSWRVYDELSDDLPRVAARIRKSIPTGASR